jgi:Na+/melibiose symporter-like transporter
MSGATARWRYAAYGLTGMPLAMSALPVYVQVPAYYSTVHALPLATLGWILFAARLVDTVQDPFLGHAIDRLRGGIACWMAPAALLLALSFAGLWLPPMAGIASGWWLAAMLVLVYTAHSMINVAYLAWGARIGGAADPAAQSKPQLWAAGWREGAGLVGVMLASVIPAAIINGDPANAATGMLWFSGLFGGLLAVAMIALLRWSPAWPQPLPASGDWRAALRRMAANARLRRLLLPYFLNALSVSLPATLALFFINDRLQAGAMAGPFLACYFAAAACGLPLWTALAARIGPAACWRLGMALAIAGFAGAGLLGPGDVWPYLAVCIAAGAALGADLAMPPVLLARLIDDGESTGIYYGTLTLLGKLALAMSGLALPVLAWFDYRPGAAAHDATAATAAQGTLALALVYAAVPCLLKLAAFLALRGLESQPLSPALRRSLP